MKNFFALIGGLTLLLVAIITLFSLLFMSDEGKIKVKEELVSPSLKYVAIQYVAMGGGAVGYCYKHVAVIDPVDKAIISNREEIRKFSVFRASCSSKVNVAWVSENNISITYSSTSRAGFSLYLKPFNKTGDVKILFTHHQE